MENLLPKLALIGYGSMGQEVERVAVEKGYLITDRFEINTPINNNKNYNFDVAIDFSLPDAVLSNIKILSELKKNVVIGATGWLSHFPEVKNLVDKSGIGLVYGSNFSLGVNLFFEIVNTASKLFNSVDGYDLMVHELHHKRKKDSPSGTAKTIAEIIIREFKNKKKILDDSVLSRAIEKDELHVSSTRGGEITGTHTVYIDSIADSIELTHRAKNRTGFALGALEAANWINGRHGIFEFKDIIKNKFSL